MSELLENTPPELSEAANNAVQQLLPEKSKDRYNPAYESFTKWKLTKNVKLKPSTLWSQYSMLNNTILTNDNLQISTYSKLIAFLKRKSDGFKSKKSKVLSGDQIADFLNNAPDNQYLLMKVALIFGIAGACRGGVLTNMTFSDIERRDNLLLIHIPDTKTKISRAYTIDGQFAELVNKYAGLRPKKIDSNRFFVNFQNGKCTSQVVGKNKFLKMPKLIAAYLKFLEANLYTGHSFRRSSATLLADSGADLTTIKRHGGWKSSSVAEGYIESSMNNKRKIDNLITNLIKLPSNPNTEDGPSASKSQKLDVKDDEYSNSSKLEIIPEEISTECLSTKQSTNDAVNVNISSQNHENVNITQTKNTPLFQFNNCNVTIQYYNSN